VCFYNKFKERRTFFSKEISGVYIFLGISVPDPKLIISDPDPLISDPDPDPDPGSGSFCNLRW